MRIIKNLPYMILILMMLFYVALQVNAQRQAEFLNRGLVRIRSGSTNYISWRMLASDPSNVSFNVYRGSTQITSISNATFYADSSGGSGDTYTVRAVVNASEQEASENSLDLSTNYLQIDISPPGSIYSANDASVGDLDGDGQYEIILKWDPNDSRDNSKSGTTSNVYIDAYTLSGSRMWRINLGRNIRAGAHYTQFQVYDLDGDGRAEMVCKTADGTTDGQGNVIGSSSADYRNSNGYILSGPEYLTVFDGRSGRAVDTVDYLPARGNVGGWGDTYGNRVDRFLACVAYLNGSTPSVVMCRGYYTRTVLVAWDFNGSSLSRRWTFDSDNGYSSYAGQGNHQLSVQDVDGDGRDEIIYGSCCIDDNGRGLWTTNLGHGDAMHVCDIDPNRPGLEKWGIHEKSTPPGSALLDARTGQIIWQTNGSDIGRGVSADLTSAPGMECWGGTDGLRTATNDSAGGSPSSANHVIWWDGDLYRELLNGTTISKYNGGALLSASGCASNNSTKSNPCLQADIFGDWREEVIWRTSDNSYLRIYTTTTSTSNRFITLMHDTAYRVAVAWQNTAYNQPPHPSFFLGQGMGTAPHPDLTFPGSHATSPPAPPTDPPQPTTPPTPLPPGTHTLEAEDAYWSSGVLESLHTGYSGSGYVNSTNAAGPYIEWSVNVSSSGSAACSFRYANGAESRPVELAVNGSTVNSSLDFPGTGAWTTWQSVTAAINLNSGTNTIRITGLAAEGIANIDRLDLTISGGTTTNCGDVNNSGSIDIVDALMTAQYYVGLNPPGFIPGNADVNGDGSINIIDALIIAQYYVGLVSSLGC